MFLLMIPFDISIRGVEGGGHFPQGIHMDGGGEQGVSLGFPFFLHWERGMGQRGGVHGVYLTYTSLGGF